MIAFIRKLSFLALVGLAPVLAQAQTTPKIVVVDIAKLYDSHWLTQEQNAKLTADQAKANDDLAQLVKEGNALVEKYQGILEQAKSPTLTADAKTKLQTDAAQVGSDIQQKQTVVNTFRDNTEASLKQRIDTFRNLMLEQIVAAVNKVGKAKGANIILDKSGPSAIGVPAVIFADDALDITDDVMKEINKDKPADKPATPGAPAAAAPAAAAPAATPLTLPGAAKK